MKHIYSKSCDCEKCISRREKCATLKNHKSATCNCHICKSRRSDDPKLHFSLRLSKSYVEWIKLQPESARAYIERLIDMDKRSKQN